MLFILQPMKNQFHRLLMTLRMQSMLYGRESPSQKIRDEKNGDNRAYPLTPMLICIIIGLFLCGGNCPRLPRWFYDLKKPGLDRPYLCNGIKSYPWAKQSESSNSTSAIESPKAVCGKQAPHADNDDQGYANPLSGQYFGLVQRMEMIGRTAICSFLWMVLET